MRRPTSKRRLAGVRTRPKRAGTTRPAPDLERDPAVAAKAGAIREAGARLAAELPTVLAEGEEMPDMRLFSELLARMVEQGTLADVSGDEARVFRVLEIVLGVPILPAERNHSSTDHP